MELHENAGCPVVPYLPATQGFIWAMAEAPMAPCGSGGRVERQIGRWQMVRRTTALQVWPLPGAHWAMADLNCRLLPCEGSTLPLS
jgi:hypothetical protein